LSNTPRQIFMLEGLGYPRPEYAHVPFVAEPGSKNKLSKRKILRYLGSPEFNKIYEHALSIAYRIGLDKTLGGLVLRGDDRLELVGDTRRGAISAEHFNPVMVEFYRSVGYLPDAILNYLVLLGWSYDDKTEDFTRQQLIDL